MTQSPPPESWWHEAEQILANQQQVLPPNEVVWNYVGPEGIPVHGGAGRVNRIRVDPDNAEHWYACAPSGGLWETWNAGLNWSVVGVDALAPLGVTDVWKDPQNPQHLWLATGDGNGGDTYSIGLLETWDAGASWTPLELAFETSQGRRIHAFAPHPSQPSTFLVASDLGVFQTADGGGSFALVQPGNARDVVWMNDSTAIAALENSGVVRSSDAGATWTSVELEESQNSIGRIQLAAQSWGSSSQRDTLYAVSGHYFQQNFLAVWQSTDAGLTWTAQSTRLTGPNLLGYTLSGADNAGQAFWDLCMEVDPENASRVLVGGVNVWESLDNGVSWSCPVHWQGAGEAHYTHADQHDFEFLPDGSVLLANDGGVFRWDNEGVVDLGADLQIAQGYALSLDTQRPSTWMIGTQDNGTNLISPQSSARILDGDGFHSMFDPTVSERLYASAYYGLLYRSDDGGRTMTNIANYYQSSGPNELGAWQTPFELHPAWPGRIVAAKKSLHWSDDGGESWTSVGGMGGGRSTALALSHLDPEVALVAKNAALYFKDSGDSEFAAIPSPSTEYIGDVAMAREDDHIWWLSTSSYEDSAQVWRSEDQGASWTNVSQGLPALPVHKLTQLREGTWMCASELGVYVWDENASAWAPYGSGLPLTPVVDVVEDTLLNRLMVSTYGRGVWCAPVPSLPEWDASVVNVSAPQTQCMFTLNGSPVLRNTGSQGLEQVTYAVTAQQGEVTVMDTVWTEFNAELTFGEEAMLTSFHLDVPLPGEWEVTFQLILPSVQDLEDSFSTSLWASGLGHTMEMTWWGDCENVDMRWHLRDAETQEVLLLSAPVAARDTAQYSWCLSEGCYEVVWNDEGIDGFSGEDCGESGGYELRGPFGELLELEEGTDFGDELIRTVCVDVPWCFADYNGDGQRSVNDLLTLLSDFGCSSSCWTDNSFDGSVGVSDLMNVLSVYGTDCEVED